MKTFPKDATYTKIGQDWPGSFREDVKGRRTTTDANP